MRHRNLIAWMTVVAGIASVGVGRPPPPPPPPPILPPPAPLPPLPAACPADWNRSCAVSAQDVFDFLSDYFDAGALADANRDGIESVQDVFDFLGFYFGGCTPCTRDIRMVVFGDSLSDVGRHFGAYAEPASPSYEGRFSNGPVWVEYLAASRGLLPANVLNYAVGGATSGLGNCCTPGGPGVLNQIDEFVHDAAATDAINPDALFVLWVGANDFETWQRTGAFETTPPNVLIDSAMANIGSAIRTLADRGARRILVGNLPDLGRIPKVTSQNDPATAALGTTGTVMFNANLAWDLSQLEQSVGVDIVLMDVNSLFDAIQSDPAAMGFTDATTACYPPGATSPCTSPSTHVFWDDVHPTTAAHRALAGLAQASLATGGVPLTPTVCSGGAAQVTFTMPTVQFTTSTAASIAGRVTGAPAGSQLFINGVAADMAPDGTFTGEVPIGPEPVVQPIVAELRRGASVLDRDRAVVIRGRGIAQGENLFDAISVELREAAIPAIRDEVAFQFLDNNQLQIGNFLPNPLRADYGGSVRWEARTTSVGFGCHNVDAELHPGFIRVRLSLHDILLTFHVHGWCTCPDPGVDCDGWIRIPEFSVYADLALRPSTSRPDGLSALVVTDITLDRPPTPTWFIGNCDLGGIDFGIIDGAIASAAGDLSTSIRTAIENQIGEVSIAGYVNQVMSKLAIGGPISDAVDTHVDPRITTIQHDPGRLVVEGDAAITGIAPSSARTLGVPHAPPPRTGNLPITGEPYGFAAAVSFEALNQLLLARADLTLRPIELTTINLGSGTLPVNAGLLAALIPSMHGFDPSEPFILRVRPTQAPMFTGEVSTDCNGLDMSMPNVIVEIVPAGQSGASPLVAFAIDLHACAVLGFNRSRAELTASLSIPDDGVSMPVFIENRVCADEPTLLRLVASLRGLLAQKLADATKSFPIPGLGGLSLNLAHVAAENGYVSLYFNPSTIHARPDLAVVEIDMPSAIDFTFPFDVRFRVQNVGSVAAAWGAWMGASLSLDPVFVNGDDLGIGQQFFNLAQNPLQPGESSWFTLTNLRAPSNLSPNQHLFILADVPAIINGGGMLCESDEWNNYASVPLQVTSADAYIRSVASETNVIGGIGPRSYRVRVGRSNFGADYLDVPVHVAIGSPVLSWGDAWVRLSRGQEVDVDVFVPTPASVGTCGQVNQFTVRACTNLQIDANRSNDCADASVAIAVPYWDLKYDIDTAPSDGYTGSSVTYRVRVTNEGNISSPGYVNSRTAICLSRHGFETWWNDCILGCGPVVPLLFNVNSLGAGQSRTYSFTYPICFGARPGYQYINAAPDYSRGAFDNCGGSNNNAARRITIH